MPAHSRTALAEPPSVEERFPDLTAEIAAIVSDAIDETIAEYGLEGLVTEGDALVNAALDYAMQRAAELVTQIDETTRDELQTMIEDAVKENLSPAELADRIGESFAFSDARADLIARTECLLPETLIDAAMVRAVHRRPYEGPVVKITTRAGRQFTATPNHPILTRRGWVATGLLNESNDLVCNAGQEHSRPFHDPHVVRPPSTIREVFHTAQAIGITRRRRTRKPDFHGDGLDGEVDVACPDGVLTFGSFSPLLEPACHGLFTPSNQGRVRFCPYCSRLLPVEKHRCFCGATKRDPVFLKALYHRAARYAERCRDSISRLAVPVAPYDLMIGQPNALGMNVPAGELQFSRLRTGPGNTRAAHEICHPVRVRADLSGHHERAHPANVELDSVVSVELCEWSGHVFNLACPDGYFTMNNGIYTGNTTDAWNTGLGQTLKDAGENYVFVNEPGPAEDEECAPIKEDGGQIWTIEEFLDDPSGHPRCEREGRPCTQDELDEMAAGEAAGAEGETP